MTYVLEAVKVRARARRNRVVSVVMFVVAGVFAALGVVMLIAGRWQGLTILSCSMIIALCGATLRFSAWMDDATAARYESLDVVS